MEFIKKENMYAILYHKIFSPFFLLNKHVKYKTIISITIQNYDNQRIFAILKFKSNGTFLNGTYAKSADKHKIKIKVESLIKSIDLNKSLILINDFIDRNLREYLEDKKIAYINISENSLIRLFRFSYNRSSRAGFPSGNGIFFNNKWYIVTFDSHHGTQRTIKLTQNGYSFDEFKDIAQFCFDETKYHLGYSKNSMKLPFPIHFARKLLKKLKVLDIQEIGFNYPIFL